MKKNPLNPTYHIWNSRDFMAKERELIANTFGKIKNCKFHWNTIPPKNFKGAFVEFGPAPGYYHGENEIVSISYNGTKYEFIQEELEVNPSISIENYVINKIKETDRKMNNLIQSKKYLQEIDEFWDSL